MRARLVAVGFWLFCSLVIDARAVLGKGGDDELEALRERAIPIRTIDPGDTDFRDLEPLKELIGPARVVVLGEATHREGSTSAVKARLARFLHEEMGFDVLAWETGLIQAWAMNAAIRDAEVPLETAARHLMAGGWASERPVETLLQHARNSWRTTRPLQMAGFDTDRPAHGAKSFLAFLRDLGERVPELALGEPERQQVEALARRVFGFLGGESPPEPERQTQRAPLEKLIELFRAQRSRLLVGASVRELVLAERFVRHALRTDELRAAGSSQWAKLRDQQMADNFLWLLDELHPDRKIIVWAATAHFIRNSDTIRNDEHPDWYVDAWQAGNFIHPELKEGLYTIAFTSYAGEMGDLFPPGHRLESTTEALAPAPGGSFEARAHALGSPQVFFDLRSTPDDHWLRGEFVSVALGRLANRARWANVIDGFLFIDEATPCDHR